MSLGRLVHAGYVGGRNRSHDVVNAVRKSRIVARPGYRADMVAFDAGDIRIYETWVAGEATKTELSRKPPSAPRNKAAAIRPAQSYILTRGT